MKTILTNFINKDLIALDDEARHIILTFFSFNPLDKLDFKIKIDATQPFINNKELYNSMQISMNDDLFLAYLFKGCKIENLSDLKEGHPDYKITKGNEVIYLEKKQGYVDGLRKPQLEWFLNNKDKKSYCVFISKSLRTNSLALWNNTIKNKKLNNLRKVLDLEKINEDDTNGT